MLALEDVIPLHVTDLKFPDTHPLRGQEGQVFAFAIRHPAGLILFETGIGRDSERMDRLYELTHHPIEAKLERHGLRPLEVAAIVNSHLHFDHGGQNASFPGVPIYAQADEYIAAHQPNYTIQRWVDFPEAQYRQIEGDKEIAPGITILSARGHTPGHQALLVETTSGPVILAGQAIYSKIEYEHLRDTGELAPEEPQDDPENYLASAQRLIQLAARRVFFSHDSSFYEAP